MICWETQTHGILEIKVLWSVEKIGQSLLPHTAVTCDFALFHWELWCPPALTQQLWQLEYSGRDFSSSGHCSLQAQLLSLPSWGNQRPSQCVSHEDTPYCEKSQPCGKVLEDVRPLEWEGHGTPRHHKDEWRSYLGSGVCSPCPQADAMQSRDVLLAGTSWPTKLGATVVLAIDVVSPVFLQCLCWFIRKMTAWHFSRSPRVSFRVVVGSYWWSCLWRSFYRLRMLRNLRRLMGSETWGEYSRHARYTDCFPHHSLRRPWDHPSQILEAPLLASSLTWLPFWCQRPSGKGRCNPNSTVLSCAIDSLATPRHKPQTHILQFPQGVCVYKCLYTWTHWSGMGWVRS